MNSGRHDNPLDEVFGIVSSDNTVPRGREGGLRDFHLASVPQGGLGNGEPLGARWGMTKRVCGGGGGPFMSAMDWLSLAVLGCSATVVLTVTPFPGFQPVIIPTLL